MLFKSAGRMSAAAGIAGLAARSVRAQTATGASVSPGLGQGCGGGMGRLLQPGGEVPVQQILETFQTNNHMIMNGVLIVSLDRLDLNVIDRLPDAPEMKVEGLRSLADIVLVLGHQF
jgi:hypothetical protein